MQTWKSKNLDSIAIVHSSKKARSQRLMLAPSFFHLGQLFDLGVDKQDYSTKLKLDFAVRDLEEQLDLVLILEYLDESLVLLQRMLCWDLNDVVYLKQRVRRKRYRITKKTRVWWFETLNLLDGIPL